jgi:hypothetical protein
MADERGSGDQGNGSRSRRGAVSAISRIRRARDQFEELTGYAPESVSALTRSEDGWEIRVEVVELERVPDTTSLLASYKVALDDNGEVMSYERCRRYTRGRADHS